MHVKQYFITSGSTEMLIAEEYIIRRAFPSKEIYVHMDNEFQML